MYLSDSLLILLFVCSVECQNVSDENKDRKVWGEREKEKEREREMEESLLVSLPIMYCLSIDCCLFKGTSC
jgi:hypothetical protein